MEELNPIWFLKHPLDSEQKSYILLDKLNNYKKHLKKDQISDPINRILLIIKELSYFRKNSTLSKRSYDKLDQQEIDVLNHYKSLDQNDIEYIMLNEVIDKCLDILYRYVNIGIELLNERNNRIKTFEILPPNGNKDNINFGIFIIRNMVTDEIFVYFWAESKIGNKEGERIGIGMKKIEDSEEFYFSLSYINIAHEMLEKNGGILKGKTPRILVCEISENFNEDSEVIRVAKEKFLEKLLKENRKLI